MKLLIIEDEKPSARRLNRMLMKNNYPEADLIHDVKSAIAYLKIHQPDLLFLDVQLSDGVSFEIFEEVEVKCPIIFTTAYDEFALQAFQLNSIDYLLKPIEEEQLLKALTKWKNLQLNNFNVQQFQQLIQNQLQEKAFKNRFTIQVGHKIIIIHTDEIECFYSENKSTFVSTETGRTYDLDVSLDHLETQLNPTHFFRISRKYLIHKKHIKEIYTHSNSRCRIQMNKFNSINLIVSRERTKDFKVWLEK
ncbi:MAG: LytTR family DNA-binding domain-containing protein [Flavobacteriaceae bacterium]|nr:LytTR family DNA-binding domain-containing protein [Flavobacteriaceae bacterium]